MIKMIFLMMTGVAMNVVTFNANAFPELPFCPMGGPPGWMHRFLDRHDHNRSPVFYPPQGYYSQSRAYPFPPPFRYGEPSMPPAHYYDKNYGQDQRVTPSQR